MNKGRYRIRLTAFILIISLFPSELAQADLFGGDVLVLGQILVQTIQQLAQLRQILKSGNDQLDLLRNINQGINDSLNLGRTLYPNADPGVFGNLLKASDALTAVTTLYGDVVVSNDSKIQTNTDQSIAEAVSLNNSIYKYTDDIDQIGEAIKSFSHSASPGGAQKLTAESMGIMLHVMNAGLRAQATSLKLQAEVLALQNHKDKEASRETLQTSEAFKDAIDEQNPKFETPRF